MRQKAFSCIMGDLSYDPMDIEHAMYMFDHRLVGCIVLNTDQSIDIKRIGTVKLDGKVIEGSFFFSFSNQIVSNVKLFGIPVRGNVDYGKDYCLTLEDFYDESGSVYDKVELILHCKKKREVSEAELKKYSKHDNTALQAAEEGIVLLKNEDNTLPIRKGGWVNLFGDGIANFRGSVTGAGRINPRNMPSLIEKIRADKDLKLNEELYQFYKIPNNNVPDKKLLERSLEKTDNAFMIITRGTGENIDNQPIEGEYYLTVDEKRLLHTLCQNFKKVIVILNTGYPIEMGWADNPAVKAILYTGIGGQAGAAALCNILTGRSNPSGKLPDTFAYDYYDIPSSKNFYCPSKGEKPILADDTIWVNTCYEEGIYVGYRYFDSFHKEAAYTFGHGLSYTTFEKKVIYATKKEVCIEVKNTGSRAGKEVVTLYVSKPGRKSEQPEKVLSAFDKTSELKPGECEQLKLEIAEKQLAVYVKEKNSWILEKGIYTFYIGGSVNEAEKIYSFTLEQEKLIQKLKYRMPSPIKFDEISTKEKLWPDGKNSGVQPEACALTEQMDCTIKRSQKSEENHNLDRTETIWKKMADDELCRLLVMYGDGWGMENKGEAGRLAPFEKYGLKEYVCADGNCGVNLNEPNIGMPSSVVVCATFNKKLACKVGKVIGEEAKEHGINMILAPAMNIHRNPLNGRHAEYFSEDPLLAGQVAGMQLRGLHMAGIAGSVKHVACNNCETARKRNHSLVSEKALREIYLRVFENLIDTEKPDTIMTGYNALNGSMCAENEVLLEGIFREEMGFTGFAMTDWNSYDTVDMVKAINAGISWLTPGERDGSRVKILLSALQNGKLSRKCLEDRAARIIQVVEGEL